MTLAQKWLTAMIGLGAAALVLSNPKGFASALNAGRGLVGGTTTDIINATPGR